MTTVAWVNGQFVDPAAPALTVLDHGFTVGDGVFETIRVVDGQAFALTRHLARLAYAMDRMGMSTVDPLQLFGSVIQVLERAPGTTGRLRVTVTSGSGPLGTTRGEGPLTVAIVASESTKPRSLTAVRAPWKRNERSAVAGIKTTSYAESVVISAYATSRGADEAILSNTHGHLCEGTSTNVLVERAGEIVTPPLAAGCLPGIARGLALEWGARAGMPVRVAAVGELDMSVLDDVVAGKAHLALTSVMRGIQHVNRLDGVSLLPGPLLSGLSNLYDARSEEVPDPPPPRVNTR